MKSEFEQLYETIVQRKSHAEEGSYTAYLFEKGIEKMERLIERLEDLDDVANIYHNCRHEKRQAGNDWRNQ